MSCFAQSAPGQSAPESPADKVEPDRRDFTTGTGIVPGGHVQVELGATWERRPDERQWTLGDLQLRLPVSPRVEIRIGMLSYLIDHDRSSRRVGFDDASLGARFLLAKRDACEIAFQIESTLPSGSRAVAERGLQPNAVLASTLKLAPDTHLVLNVGASRASENGQRFDQVFVASSLRHRYSERLSLFGETYAFNRDERGGSSRKFAAAGVVVHLDRSTALDARVIKGIGNGSGTDISASLGVSRLF